MYEWFQVEANQDLIKKLQGADLKLYNEINSESQQHHSLSGKNLVITGTLPSLTRNQAMELIEKAGGKISNSVSNKTDYVIVGENPGSKLEKAEKLGITTLNESELLKLINN